MATDRRRCLEEVARAIEDGSTFIATTHVRPDGDALGSLTALMMALDHLGKTVHAHTQDSPAAMYRFLPAIERVSTEAPSPDVVAAADAGIAVDCASLDRTGTVGEHLVATGMVICIDHHAGGTPFGDVRCVIGESSSTAELMIELLDVLGVPLTREIATSLLTAHVFDTGRFSQRNTTAQAFRNGARLLEAGAEPEAVVRHMYDTVPLARIQIRGRALQRAEIDGPSGLVWSVLSHQDFDELGARAEDTEGIVADLRGVGEGRLAGLVSEVSPRECRVSLRARDGDVDVAELAATFGGGGHTRAAGCTIEDAPGEAVRRLIEAARAQAGARTE